MYYIGIDIGGTKCALSLGRESDGLKPDILDKTVFSTAGKTPNDVLDMFLYEAEKTLHACGLSFSDVGGLGISCGGPLDASRGIIMSPPNLPGWDNIHITEFFEKHTAIKSKLQNDANACAAAEWLFGAGKGFSNVVFLTFGTGLGAGLILDGRLYSGTCDMAGEVGHVRLAPRGPIGYGKLGSAEGFCSGGGIARMGQHAVKEALRHGEYPRLLEIAGTMENITAKLMAELAETEHDELCLRIYRECGKKLGMLLSIIVDILNPERIILGGVFMRSASLIAPSMEKVMKEECLPLSEKACKVVPACLGENIGDYAALSLAMLAARKTKK